MRNFFKTLVPLFLRKKFRERRNRKKTRSFTGKPAQEIFTEIHSEKFWGDAETVSGSGSRLSETKNIREALPALFSRYRIRSLLDVPCGDFNWMKEVDLSGIDYLGGDIVPAIVSENQKRFTKSNIQFRKLNILEDDLPESDLILCRDCLGHLSTEDVLTALDNFRRSGSRFLAVTSFPGEKNRDIVTGDWRPIDLEAAPFHLTGVKEKIAENGPGKFLLLIAL